jgi:hypothetical protein
MAAMPRTPILLLAAAILLTLAGSASALPDLRTRLPIVVIDADGPIVDDPKVGARMRIIHGGGINTPRGRANVYDGRIGIEVRGQSSQRFPKKQFGFETVDADGDNRNVSLLGLPEENDWILYAAYNDATLMRNVVAYRAARLMGRYASRTRYVEVVLNGRYWGVYVLMEKLKLDRARVPEPAGRDGFLIEYTTAGKIDPGDGFFRTPVTRTPIVFDDPGRDDLSRAQAGDIARRVARFERALYARSFRHPTRGWRAHADEAAMVDYVLLYEYLRNYDAFSASTFIHLGPRDRLSMGPAWDFDLAMGNPVTPLPARGCSLCDRRWVSRLYRDGAFVRAMERRWRELRRERFPARLRQGIARDRAALRPAAVRNLRRWPVVGETPLPSGLPDAALARVHRREADALRTWLTVRAGWLTAALPRLPAAR